jgi:hypothetical protein
MTEAEMARVALQVQDAVNLSGVVHSFSAVLTDLWKLADERNEGTLWVNTHPVSVLFADKITDLAQSRLSPRYSEAYAQCGALVGASLSQNVPK